jgi:hypothetical protein
LPVASGRNGGPREVIRCFAFVFTGNWQLATGNCLMPCFSVWDIQGCGCVGCIVTFNVHGCAGLPLQGALVAISGGNSGTTDSAGNVNLDVGAAGTYSVTVSKTRFTSQTVSRTVTCGGLAITVTLIPTSSYHCLTSSCADPLPNVLHYTVATGETGTVTWNTVLWGETGGNNAGFSTSLDFACDVDGGTCACDFQGLISVACPPSFSAVVQDVGGWCPGARTATVSE